MTLAGCIVWPSVGFAQCRLSEDQRVPPFGVLGGDWGTAVALDGDVAVIAERRVSSGSTRAGRAYVIEREATGWSFVQPLFQTPFDAR